MSSSIHSIDLVCLGRAGVDFYADQIGDRLEDVGSFSKYIGGSSTNIACCSSRMGLSTALITRVGNEHMGQFIREQLQREGVDTRNVVTDPDRLTAIVVLGIKDQDTFPLIFYRENCADMAISIDDLDEDLITNAKALLITGTHFSTSSIYETSKAALAMARSAGVKTAIDIDYRPVLWGLTSKGDGETRFIANDEVSKHLQGILSEFDLIVGTEEEIHIAGGSTDTLTALRTIRSISNGAIVLKRGPFGATVFDGAIPEHIDDGITVKGVQVEVLNVLGAGDAFVSGFLRGWLNDEGYEQALRYANACGALVVSRHGCTPAMPTREELDYFLDNAESIPRPDVDTQLNYLHRVTTRSSTWDSLLIHAFDHRQQLEVMADEAGVSRERICELKDLLLRATQQVVEAKQIHGQAGFLCDGIYGQRVLNAATGTGTWIARPVEMPKTRPLLFEHGASIGTLIHTWPREHVIKCLFFYAVDDADDIRLQQEQRMHELYHACCQSGHELLLEIIPPPGDPLSVGESVCRSVERVYELGIRPDWWKVPCMDRTSVEQMSSLIDKNAPHCRGIVVLGLDAPLDVLGEGFKAFRGVDRVKGFAVGRSIFGQPSQKWFAGALSDEQLIAEVSNNYTAVIELWNAR
ncbi:MAG: 5-dehydro-2-deoxygluconokinase [Granulosicoccus sp.]|jgi:5-dehydro-2-deoxygluconokinase